LLRLKNLDVLGFDGVSRNLKLVNVAIGMEEARGEGRGVREEAEGRGGGEKIVDESLLLEMAAGVCFLGVAMGSNRPGWLLEIRR
jgi:hypothetical protein